MKSYEQFDLTKNTYLVYQLKACFFFGGETTWTPVLTQISEKTDFSPALASKPADRTPSIPAQQQIDD